MNVPAVIVYNVTKTYNDRKIFNGLSIEIPSGQFSVLLGRNGSGKSTLLRLIAGMECSELGDIKVLGSNVEVDSVERRQRVAFISELITLDAAAPLKKVLKSYYPLQPKWDESIFNKFMDVFGLSIDKRFGTLSRGQKIQFFFALAAAGQPDLYLLDEVTSVLDANARYEVLNHVSREVNNGATAILATNIAAETHNFANDIVFLINGVIGLRCSVEDLQTRFAKFRVPLEDTSTYKVPSEAKPVQLNRDGSTSYLIAANAKIRESAPALSDQRGVTIEDLFIYFTGPENK